MAGGPTRQFGPLILLIVLGQFVMAVVYQANQQKSRFAG